MTQGNNIKLNIEKSLSYTIHKKLDDELKQNVQLNYSQWVSVFDIIKNDDATQEKQYSGGDESIKNRNNYVVKQGQSYEITENAWNIIINIAKQALGREDTQKMNKQH